MGGAARDRRGRGHRPAARRPSYSGTSRRTTIIAAAFLRLVDHGVLAILGPALTDGALAVRPLADEVGVPCINYAGNDEARSAWLFQFQIGSLEDEPALLVDHLVRRRLTRVALCRTRRGSGTGWRRSSGTPRRRRDARSPPTLRVGARRRRHRRRSSPPRDARRPTRVAFVGFWRAAHGLALEMKAQDWTVPAVANSALMYGHADPAWARDWDGWTYVDTFSEGNPRFAALARTAAAAGRTAGPGEAGAYDMGRLLAEGIARAPELTRAGIRAGLERVKALPAATGRAGTLMGFGNWDRGALKGPYLVLREWRGGRSVEA